MLRMHGVKMHLVFHHPAFTIPRPATRHLLLAIFTSSPLLGLGDAAYAALGHGADRGYEIYLDYDEGESRYKVFAVGKFGAWPYDSALTFEEAEKGP